MLNELYAHQEWADALIWRTVAESAEKLVDDSALLAKLHHVVTVQVGFLSAWKNVTFHPEAVDGSSLEALLPAARRYHADARAFVGSPEADLLAMQPISLAWHSLAEKHFGRTLALPTTADTMHQVVMHSMHHRGQICTRIRELGAEPPLTDLIAWVWFGKPAAEWP